MTMIVVAFGISALVTNRGSYSMSFSTVLRITYDADLGVDMTTDDMVGKDPLPPYLETSTLRLTPGDEQHHPSKQDTSYGRLEESRAGTHYYVSEDD